MPTAYHPSNAEWVRPIESLTSDGVRELQRLQAENAKLREEFNKMDVWHSKELTAAMDENAKLRELCADIYKRFRGVVFECWAYSSEDFRMYEQRMSELGVEVEL